MVSARELITRRPLIIPGRAGSGPILRETLFAASARQSVVTDLNDADTSFLENGINTPAGTHDGSDLTYDSTYAQDGFSLPAHGFIQIFYTMDVATYPGPIAFVRWKLRHFKDQISGNSVPAGTVINAWTAAAGPVALAQVPGIVSIPTFPAILDTNIDALVDPFTLAPWTLAGLNARKAGFGLTTENDFQGAFNSTTEAKCSEFKLEVWG